MLGVLSGLLMYCFDPARATLRRNYALQGWLAKLGRIVGQGGWVGGWVWVINGQFGTNPTAPPVGNYDSLRKPSENCARSARCTSGRARALPHVGARAGAVQGQPGLPD